MSNNATVYRGHNVTHEVNGPLRRSVVIKIGPRVVKKIKWLFSPLDESANTAALTRAIKDASNWIDKSVTPQSKKV